MDSLILKIAKKLKTFTLDDLIIMGDLEKNSTIETLNKLVTENKIKRTGKFFEYAETQHRKENYKIIDRNIKVKISEITVLQAVDLFMANLPEARTFETQKTYRSMFNSHIIPFFKDTTLGRIKVKDVEKFKIHCREKQISERRIKNILALLNQLIRYFQNIGRIKRTCIFEVKRLEKETKRQVQILNKSQVEQLFAILKKDYRYLIPIVEKIMKEKIKLNDTLTGERISKESQKRKIRNDFAKIKQKLNLGNFMFDDLKESGIEYLVF